MNRADLQRAIATTGTTTPGAMLTLVGVLLVAGAALNVGTGLIELLDQPPHTEGGAAPAAVTYWGLSSIVFGASQAVGAWLLFRQRREGAAIVYVVAALDTAYWIAEIPLRPMFSVVVLAVLAAVVTITAAKRHELT